MTSLSMEESDEIISDKTNCENSVIVDISDGQDPKQVEVDNLIQDNLENKKHHSMKVKGSRKNDTDFNSGIFTPQRSFWVLFKLESARSEGDPFVYEPQSRHPFIMRVFLMLLAALSVTAGFTTIAYVMELFTDKFISLIVMATCLGIFLIIQYMFDCYPYCRKGPLGYTLFIIAVITLTGACAAITCQYNTTVILAATIALFLLTLVCLLLACTSFDFTRYILIVCGILIAIFAASLVLTTIKFATGTKLSTLTLVLTFVSCIACSVMLIIEFQMVLGGKSVELCEDEHVYGAFLLYDSIISLFLQLLYIIGSFMGDD